MTNFALNNPFFTQSHAAAQFIGGIRSVYVGLGNFLNLVFLLACAVPAVPFIYILLYYIRFKLSKTLIKDIAPKSADDYKTLRIGYDKLSASLRAMDFVDIVSVKKSPFLVRGLMKQIFQIQTVLRAQQVIMRNKISEYNSTNEDLPKGWSVIDEQELWTRRNKNYEYLI